MQKLREKRKEYGYTLKQLGEMVGVAESTMSQYENGKRNPDYNTLVSLANVLHTSVDYLLTGSPAPALSTQEQELEEYLEELRTRPEMRMYFSLAKGATKQEVEEAVQIVEEFLKSNPNNTL